MEARALDSVSDGVIYVGGKAGSPSLQRVQSLFGEKRISTVVVSP